MFSFLSLACSLAILYFVLRYRVHVTVTYDDRRNRTNVARPSVRRGRVHSEVGTVERRKGNGTAGGVCEGPPRRNEVTPCDRQDVSNKRDIADALIGLGCSKPAAKLAADKAVNAGPAEFDVLLRRAIQEAA